MQEPTSHMAVWPDPEELLKAGDHAMSCGADMVEFFMERSRDTLITLSEDKINCAKKVYKFGVGVRVLQGRQTGYAYCDSTEIGRIRKAVEAASALGPDTVSAKATGVPPIKKESMLRVNSSAEQDEALKAGLLHRANSAARKFHPQIVDVTCTYHEIEREIRIVNSRGLFRQELRSYLNFDVSVFAEGKTQSSGHAYGGGQSMADMVDSRSPEMTAEEAAGQAVRMLEARECPVGHFPVIIHRGWGGMLFHEAAGHGLEGDYLRKGTSVFSGRLGQRVASEKVTLIDDGTFAHGRGTMVMDDEGTPAKKNVLIENGILRNYMYDSFNAGLMKTESTGNARREDFKHPPLPRMTNTYIAAGQDDPDDMIRSVRSGLLARSLGHGQVDIISGRFVFEVTEGYWIEDGRITYPVKNATLIGNGPDILNKISAVGHDLEIETGTGYCGKDGQTVPISVGQPTIMVSGMTVGGTRIGA